MTERRRVLAKTSGATLAGLNGSGSCDKLASPRPIRSGATDLGCARAFVETLRWRERGRTVAGAARSAAVALDHRLAKLRFAARSRATLSSRFRSVPRVWHRRCHSKNCVVPSSYFPRKHCPSKARPGLNAARERRSHGDNRKRCAASPRPPRRACVRPAWA